MWASKRFKRTKLTHGTDTHIKQVQYAQFHENLLHEKKSPAAR
jgi:hypothetical protein